LIGSGPLWQDIQNKEIGKKAQNKAIGKKYKIIRVAFYLQSYIEIGT